MQHVIDVYVDVVVGPGNSDSSFDIPVARVATVPTFIRAPRKRRERARERVCVRVLHPLAESRANAPRDHARPRGGWRRLQDTRRNAGSDTEAGMRSRGPAGPCVRERRAGPVLARHRVSRSVRLVSRPSDRASVPNLTGPPKPPHTPAAQSTAVPRDYSTSGRAAWTYHEGVPAV